MVLQAQRLIVEAGTCLLDKQFPEILLFGKAKISDNRARHWCLPHCPGQVEFVNYSCGAS